MESRVKKDFQARLDQEENEASQVQLDPWVSKESEVPMVPMGIPVVQGLKVHLETMAMMEGRASPENQDLQDLLYHLEQKKGHLDLRVPVACLDSVERMVTLASQVGLVSKENRATRVFAVWLDPLEWSWTVQEAFLDSLEEPAFQESPVVEAFKEAKVKMEEMANLDSDFRAWRACLAFPADLEDPDPREILVIQVTRVSPATALP